MSEETALATALDTVLLENPGLPALTADQREALVTHGVLLARWNRVHNLTRLERPEDVARRHFADSLSGLTELERHVPALGTAVADVGSGAGFPGVVAALLWPQRQVTAVEAARKRASFLQLVARELGLPNLSVENHREEQVAPGRFDLVLTRATLQWPELPRLGRLLASGGWLAGWVSEEPSEADWQQRLARADEAGFEEGARVPYAVRGLPDRAVLVARRS